MIDDNRLIIAGRLLEAVEIRRSPAGIPIARFTLDHASRWEEGGVERSQSFLVGVRAVGEALCSQLQGLPVGQGLRIRGCLARSRQRSEDYRLLISAQRIELLKDSGG